MEEGETKKALPSADDPVGTRYVLDGDGDIIVDRRAPESRLRNALIYGALALLTAIAGLSVYSAFQQAEEADQQEFDTLVTLYEIRQGQRDICETNSNTLRQDIRSEFVDLKESVLIPVFSEVRDTIPPGEETYGILDDAVDRMERRIDTIETRIPDNDCADLYPLLDNPETEADEEGT